MLNPQRSLHLLQILTAGAAGEYAQIQLQVPTTDEMVHFIQVGAQVLIAIVTCWAAVRKAMQDLKKPPVAPTADVPV